MQGGCRGGTSYKAGKCSMRTVGCGTSVGKAYAVYLQSTYMELSLPGNVGAARKVARGGEGPTEVINAARGL